MATATASMKPKQVKLPKGPKVKFSPLGGKIQPRNLRFRRNYAYSEGSS